MTTKKEVCLRMHRCGTLGDGSEISFRGIAPPPGQRALLPVEAAETLNRANRIKDRLDGALVPQEGARACTVLAAAGKDVAIVCFDDGDCVIVADLPEREEWDQTLLAEAAEVTSHGWRHNPAEYVRTEIKGSEAASRSSPALLRHLLDPARAIEASKCSDRIKPAGKEVA
jgi:hypothetical protein